MVEIDELICTLLVIITILSGIVYFETRKCKDDCLIYNTSNLVINTSLIVCSVSSILFILMAIPKYYHYYKLEKAAHYLSKYDHFLNSNLIGYIIFDIVFALIHPNLIFKNKEFTTGVKWNLRKVRYCVNDILLAIQLFRAYYIIKIVVVYSRFYSPRADRICKMMGKKLSMFFSFKALLISHTAFTLILCTLVISFALAYMLKIIEGPVTEFEEDGGVNDYNDFGNCYWNVFITMTTVGYGDYFPVSVLGRVVGCLISMFGTIIVAFIVGYFQELTNLSDSEKSAIEFVQRLNSKEEIRSTAAHYFISNFKFAKTKKDLEKEEKVLTLIDKQNLIKLAKERYDSKLNYKYTTHQYQVNYNMENDVDKIKSQINNLDLALVRMNRKISEVNEKAQILIQNLEGTNII